MIERRVPRVFDDGILIRELSVIGCLSVIELLNSTNFSLFKVNILKINILKVISQGKVIPFHLAKKFANIKEHLHSLIIIISMVLN